MPRSTSPCRRSASSRAPSTSTRPPCSAPRPAEPSPPIEARPARAARRACSEPEPGYRILRALRQRTANLSPKEREVFIAYHLRGLSEEDIAIIFEISEEAVRFRLRTAKQECE